MVRSRASLSASSSRILSPIALEDSFESVLAPRRNLISVLFPIAGVIAAGRLATLILPPRAWTCRTTVCRSSQGLKERNLLVCARVPGTSSSVKRHFNCLSKKKSGSGVLYPIAFRSRSLPPLRNFDGSRRRRCTLPQ